jgi:hypothetical protein
VFVHYYNYNFNSKDFEIPMMNATKVSVLTNSWMLAKQSRKVYTKSISFMVALIPTTFKKVQRER